MTSPGPRGRETAETAETAETYSGGVRDRAARQRSDPGFLDAPFATASTRLIPMWRDQCVVSGEPAVPVILPAAEAGAVMNAAAEGVFLGLDDRGRIFAADLSPASESLAVQAAGGEPGLGARGPGGPPWPGRAALLGDAHPASDLDSQS